MASLARRPGLASRPHSLAFALALAGGCGGGDPSVGSDPKSTPAPVAAKDAQAAARGPGAGAARRVEVAVLDASVARIDLVLPGEVQGARDALLAAALGGYVEKVFVANGDAVRAGQLLARIDASSHTARLDQAKVEFAASEREFARVRAMRDAVSQSQLDVAEARHAAAKAALATAQVAVDRAIMRAPFAGTVAALEMEVGEVAASGAPLLRLVQLDPVKVTVAVADRDVASLAPGMKVQVTTGGESGFHEGEISHVNPAADLRTRSFEVEVRVPNEDGALKPGMIASVRLHRELGGDALVIPQDWVVTRIEGLGVFVEREGAARWAPLKLGPVMRDQVTVVGGIEKGARIIMNGHRELVDGDPVLVARVGACCKDGRAVFE